MPPKAPAKKKPGSFSEDWAKKTYTGRAVKKAIDTVFPKKKKAKSGW